MGKSKLSKKYLGKGNPFYGKRHTKEWIKRESRRKKGKNNPMYGRRHSAATRKKIRLAALRRGKAKRK